MESDLSTLNLRPKPKVLFKASPKASLIPFPKLFPNTFLELYLIIILEA